MPIERKPGESDKDYIARLQAQNAQLNAAVTAKSTISFKVSEKGAVSVYGLQRMPVTLYAEQWERLGAAMPKLNEFVVANHSKLKFKATETPAAE